MPIVVSNASPLILLSEIGEFERLRDLFGQISITPQVFDEVVVRGQGKPGAFEVDQAAFIHAKAVSSRLRIAEIQQRFHVGEGEASTIVLAGEVKADVVLIDDKTARGTAKALGLKVAGTMRVLELAFERQLITDLRAVYVKMQAGRTRISPSLLNASLSRFRLPPLT